VRQVFNLPLTAHRTRVPTASPPPPACFSPLPVVSPRF